MSVENEAKHLAVSNLACPPQGELGRSDAMRRRAVEFPDQKNFIKALRLLHKLATEGPIDYLPVASDNRLATLLPEWSYKRLRPLLDANDVSYSETEVIPVSDLTAEERAQLRGRNLRKG